MVGVSNAPFGQILDYEKKTCVVGTIVRVH
jgi:hypothetical protein